MTTQIESASGTFASKTLHQPFKKKWELSMRVIFIVLKLIFGRLNFEEKECENLLTRAHYNQNASRKANMDCFLSLIKEFMKITYVERACGIRMKT